MRRSEIKRRTPLRPSQRPIRPRKKELSKRRFSKRRNEAFREWMREQRCVIAHIGSHSCWGNIECCHIKSRGAGGDDVGNCYAACTRAHRSQHVMGIKSFAAFYSLDLAAIAQRLAERWLAEQAA